MDNIEFRTQIHQLEDQIGQLNAQVQSGSEPTRLTNRSQHILRLLVSNWVLLSFLLALAGGMIVWLGFGVDPFEDARNAQTTKKLSEFYRALGDQLFDREEWQAAEDAYRAAVEINRDNAAATYGIAKAQVLQPPEGERFVSPDIVGINVDYFMEHFPHNYQTDYLNGMRYLLLDDNTTAKFWFEQSINEQSNFASYKHLGDIYLSESNIIEGINDYQNALRLEPYNSSAHDNLGYAYLLKAQFYLAADHLQTASELSPTLDTYLGLGDAYRYQGNSAYALQLHQFALSRLNDEGVADEKYASGVYIYYYMPKHDPDSDVWMTTNHVDIWKFQDKQMFLYFDLSFDYALTGDMVNADREFQAAYQLEPDRASRDYFSNSILSIENFLPLSAEAKVWFNRQRTKLAFP